MKSALSSQTFSQRYFRLSGWPTVPPKGTGSLDELREGPGKQTEGETFATNTQ